METREIVQRLGTLLSQGPDFGSWNSHGDCNSSSRLSTALMDTLRGSYIHTGKHSDTEGKDKCIFLENYSAALSS